MFKSGLVSISFRQYSPEEIVDFCKQANISGIEWGGDIHCPHGDLERAKEVRELTESAGIKVAAYGSYYRCEEDKLKFIDVLASAKALGAPVIRVWAGSKGAEDASDEYKQMVTKQLIKCAEMAAKEGIKVATEYHGGTLTDFNDNAADLFNNAQHENLLTYWQPPIRTTVDYRLEGLKALQHKVVAMHVFQWDFLPEVDTPEIRLPLSEGKVEWMSYFEVLKEKAQEQDYYTFLEFFTDNNKDNFFRDAATLNEWLDELNT
ncbi:sugar phosphate isomerase/epimerase [Lentisphaerota bacterium WC36G]|nr:sugar phosphate isomerase/epimerase [Lentisphaerae bacterium WC36]